MCIFASHQCADYVCTSYAGAGEAHVARICSIQATMVLLRYHSQPPSSLPKNTVIRNQLHLSESSVSEYVRLCDTHMAYTYGTYVMTFHLTFLSVTHHVRTYKRTL